MNKLLISYQCWWKTGSFVCCSEYLAPPCSPWLQHCLSRSLILSSVLTLSLWLLSDLRDHWVSFIYIIQQHFYCLFFKSWHHKKPNEWHCCHPPVIMSDTSAPVKAVFSPTKQKETLNILRSHGGPQHCLLDLEVKLILHCCYCFFNLWIQMWIFSKAEQRASDL